MDWGVYLVIGMAYVAVAALIIWDAEHPPAKAAPMKAPTRNWPRKYKQITRIAGLAALILSLAKGLDWAYDQWDLTSPRINPSEGASVPPNFIVANRSKYFDMRRVFLVCDIEDTRFDIGNGQTVGFGMPFTSQRENPTLHADGDPAEFRCSPTDFMTFKDGVLSLAGLTTKLPGSVTAIRLRYAIVRIGVKYRTFPWPHEREVISSAWTYSGATNKWSEVLPRYQ